MAVHAASLLMGTACHHNTPLPLHDVLHAVLMMLKLRVSQCWGALKRKQVLPSRWLALSDVLPTTCTMRRHHQQPLCRCSAFTHKL